jgi:hypothetical protein
MPFMMNLRRSGQSLAAVGRRASGGDEVEAIARELSIEQREQRTDRHELFVTYI